MKIFLLIATVLLWSCASSPQPSPVETDNHEGHDHTTQASSTDDPHAGHDHANADSSHDHKEQADLHEGHDHANADSSHDHKEQADLHEGHDHANADSSHDHKEQADLHEGHDHAEQTTKTTVGTEHEIPGEIVFTPAQATAIGLTTETVKPAAFESIIRCAGQIAGAQGEVYTVTATTDGIVSLPSSVLSPGRKVSKGETLATLSAQTMVGGDQNAKNELAFQTAKKEYERAKNLIADKIISEKEFEQIKLNYRTQQMARQNGSKEGVKITSPNGGYITELLVSNGQFVSSGTPIATVSETRNLELRVDVPAKYASRLASVRSANFLSSDGAELYRLDDLSGRVLSYGRTASNGSAYLPLTFAFANRAGVVSGSFVEVFLMFNSSTPTISVPLASIIEEQGSHYVMVQLDEECYEKRLVQIGSNNGERAEVKHGLNAGETVVNKGAYQVKMAANSSAIPDGHNH